MISFFPSRTVALELFGFGIHWYGLLYFAAFVLAWFLVPHLQKYRQLTLSADNWSSLISAAVIGVIVGGRLGYVFFYAPSYYLENPLQIFAVWNGGMASHGGFIGVAIAMLFVLRKKTWDDILRIADVIVIPVAIGLGLGRLGNFINQELYGTVTSLPWGMNFPGADGLRHPIQLYDFAAMMLLAAALFLSLRSSVKPGRTLALFLILYSIVRILIEFIRDQAGVPVYILTEGQWLTIPILVLGLMLFVKKGNR
ncbi:prolipoprotein diacylglyceryl transferase [Candidatus Peribacteria bacterium]|nr:MAG: prolipoprotein diacylglyceryl transferase [Candidatus Peribacteria bacterium]